jgi:hypothetical protein
VSLARPKVTALLITALAALAAWRAACVLAGPDIDTDAYAHHMIARAILADPRDLAIHWVWLPLFHYLQVPLVALGGTMNTVRWANVALAAATPWVLFRYVRDTARPGVAWTSPTITALLAALFAAGCPIVMQMGTTAQPEPLFALLVLGVAIAVQERRYVPAAAMLGAATMLRYEAWACLAVIAFATAVEPWTSRRFGGKGEAPGTRGAWLVVAIPLALIALWAALRRPVDGRWFGFLGQTREFATGVVHEQTALDGGVVGLLNSIVYYPLIVPFRVLGPVLALVPFGIVRTVRQEGARFVCVLGACLGFISLTWIMRSSLGLDRHFVVVVPLYATFAAQGAAAIANGVARLATRIALPPRAATAGRWLAGGIAIAALVGLGTELDIWMGFWKGSIERGWPERAAIGAYLRTLAPRSTIFCDDATLEILSGLDRHRFDRHWIDDPHTWDLVEGAAQAGGVAYVATWSRKLVGHELAGDVVFRAGQDRGDPGTGVAVMRIAPDAGHAAR